MPEPEVDAAACAGLSAPAALQVQRLVLKVLTHILKEGRANAVQVSFEAAPQIGMSTRSGWRLHVRDNGTAMPPGPDLVRRAAQIGVRLEVGPAPQEQGAAAACSAGIGTELQLTWPAPTDSASPGAGEIDVQESAP